MSEKFSKTGLSSCSTWSLFAENTAFEESDAVSERPTNSLESTRLHATDLSKYGHCPSQQRLKIVACQHCNKLLVLTALQKHYELKHPKQLGSVKPSPPKRCTPSSTLASPTTTTSKVSYSKSKVLKSNNKSFIRIEEVNHHEANVKIEEVPLTIPDFNHISPKVKLAKIDLKKLSSEKKAGYDKSSISSPGGQLCIQVKGNIKKIPQMKDKEYDVDKHCGVWIPEIDKNCTRSLTCKTHPLSMRRQVPGRSKEFDDLLAEHRNRVKSLENVSIASVSPQSNSRGGTPVHSPYGFDKIVFPTVPGPSTMNSNKDFAGQNLKSPKGMPLKSLSEDANFTKQIFVDGISEDVLNSTNLPTLSYHPKPIKMSNFGARKTDCSCRIFSRRMDHFRNATASMLDRFNHVTFSTSKSKNGAKTGPDGNIIVLTQLTTDDKRVRSALQDPLQNGILHKQKTKIFKNVSGGGGGGGVGGGGIKRQLSATDGHQGIIPDSQSYAASAKRRHSAEVPNNDNFGLNTSQQQPIISRSVSNPPEQSPTLAINSLNAASASSMNTFLMNDITDNMTTLTAQPITTSLNSNSSSTSIFTGSFMNTLSSVNTTTIDSDLVQTLGVTPTSVTQVLNQQQQQQQPRQQPDHVSYATAKVVAAPNITITQGMIVSLPNTVLQNSSQSFSQIKELITQTTPNRTVQSVHSASILKQGISEANSIQNGVKNTSSTNSSSSQHQHQAAPNVTVTASPSLTGVLQGHALSAVGSVGKATTYKRLNSSHGNDSNNVIQQLIVHHNNRDMLQKQQQQQQTSQHMTITHYKQSSNHPPIQQAQQRSQTNQQTAQLNSLSPAPNIVQTVSRQQQQQSFLNSPSTTHHVVTPNLTNINSVQKLQKIQLQQQQQQQQQLQGQQFIAMHHGGAYHQQILPKLPTIPQNMGQFQTQQFQQAAATPSSLQFISQQPASTSLQQHHGGALS